MTDGTAQLIDQALELLRRWRDLTNETVTVTVLAPSTGSDEERTDCESDD